MHTQDNLNYKNYEVNYNEYLISINTIENEDCAGEILYCVYIFEGYETVYEGDEDFYSLSEAIERAKQIIDNYEEDNNSDIVTDWHDYYGVRPQDFY